MCIDQYYKFAYCSLLCILDRSWWLVILSTVSVVDRSASSLQTKSTVEITIIVVQFAVTVGGIRCRWLLLFETKPIVC